MTEAYDEEKLERRPICGSCGYVGQGETTDEIKDDIVNHVVRGSCSQGWRIGWATITVHHDAVTEEVWVPDIVTIIDEEAYEACSVCNAKK